eukprot:Opistho-1_new@50612
MRAAAARRLMRSGSAVTPVGEATGGFESAAALQRDLDMHATNVNSTAMVLIIASIVSRVLARLLYEKRPPCFRHFEVLDSSESIDIANIVFMFPRAVRQRLRVHPRGSKGTALTSWATCGSVRNGAGCSTA